MSYIRFWPLFGVYSKDGDFSDIRNIAKQDLKLFLIMLRTIIDIVHVFSRKMDAYFLNVSLFVVFVEEAFIFEIRNIKKRIRRNFLIFVDILEMSNEYS